MPTDYRWQEVTYHRAKEQRKKQCPQRFMRVGDTKEEPQPWGVGQAISGDGAPKQGRCYTMRDLSPLDLQFPACTPHWPNPTRSLKTVDPK